VETVFGQGVTARRLITRPAAAEGHMELLANAGGGLKDVHWTPLRGPVAQIAEQEDQAQGRC